MSFVMDIREAAQKAGVGEEALEAASSRVVTGEATSADRDLLRLVTPPQKRPCGDCDMCCKAPAIEERVLGEDGSDENFEPKPACQTCQFAKGKGCSIYDNRPSICKDYLCLWSMGLIPAVNYPMKRGVCWTIQPVDGSPGSAILIGHTLDIDVALNDDYNMNVIGRFIDVGRGDGSVSAVTMRDSKNAICFLPDGTGFRAPIDQTDPMKMLVKDHEQETFEFRTERSGR